MGALGRTCCLVWAICVCLGLTGCGGGTAPKMEWGGSEFLGFPWPNDLRRNPDGTVDIEGFPGTGNPLLKAILDKGVPYMHGFGTNSGVIFQFNGPLDTDSLPSALDSLEDDAVAMLVNLDQNSPLYLQRIPLRVHFDPLSTLYQPGHLLTLLPVPGYALEPDTLYGAILFSGILDDSSKPILPAPLISALTENERPASINADTWDVLQQQWGRVSGYVSGHTEWDVGQLAGFTVYRTMNPTEYTFPVAQAVAAIDDETIINSVEIVHEGLMCGYYNHIPMVAQVALPVWQQGTHPYSLGGGMVQIDESTGLAVQQGVESVDMSIDIGCTGGATPKIPMIFAEGTGGTHYSATNISGGFYEQDPFDHVALAVAPHYSGDRSSPVLSDFASFLGEFGVQVDSSDLQGITFYNLVNPAANIGNHIQSAADQLYLRRVATLLPQILERHGPITEPLNFDFSTFSVRDDIAVLAGHSQGASVIPMAMAMDNTFNIGFLSGAPSHAYFQAVHRGSIRQLLPLILAGLVDNEVDYHHPLMQILQMMHGPADSVNYVPFMKPDYLMQVAGFDDACVPREASAALGLAFARAGFMELAQRISWQYDYFDPDFVLGLTEDDHVMYPVMEGNLPGGGVGLFIQLPGGHSWYGAQKSGLDFLQRAIGAEPDRIIREPSNTDFSLDCDFRREQGSGGAYY
ncbi:hypothetical protein [Ketobacter alkanivorans]|nr:hypothetical protein [Ketobacter alkanivorans]